MSQQHHRAVKARLQRGWRPVWDLAATKSVAARFSDVLKIYAVTNLVAERSTQIRQMVIITQSPTIFYNLDVSIIETSQGLVGD